MNQDAIKHRTKGLELAPVSGKGKQRRDNGRRGEQGVGHSAMRAAAAVGAKSSPPAADFALCRGCCRIRIDTTHNGHEAPAARLGGGLHTSTQRTTTCVQHRGRPEALKDC